MIKRLEAKCLMVMAMRTVPRDAGHQAESDDDDVTHLLEFSLLDRSISLMAFPKHEHVTRFKRH